MTCSMSMFSLILCFHSSKKIHLALVYDPFFLLLLSFFILVAEHMIVSNMFSHMSTSGKCFSFVGPS